MTALADRLAPALGEGKPEYLLSGDLGGRESAEHPAAVLIAITDRPDPGLILTQRRADLRTHAGQIAFPGGRIDPGEDAVSAALREANEEIHLDPSAVRVIGPTDRYRTITEFLVTPVIGIIPADLPLRPNEFEVADLFEAPLDFVIDSANHRRRELLFEGKVRHYYEIEWCGRRIWGATAAMIVNLSRRLGR